MEGTTAEICVRCAWASSSQPSGSNQRIKDSLSLLHRVQADDGHEQPVRMRERQSEQPTGDARDVAGVVSRLAGEPEVLVRQQDALGTARGTARVEQRGRVFGRPGDDLRGVGPLHGGELVLVVTQRA